MPKHVADFRCRIDQAVRYASDIINDAELFAVEIGVPRREMLFILLDQCLGRCECASPQDRTALKRFLAQREKAFQGNLSARMDAFWNPNMYDDDELLDASIKGPYWRKESQLAYECPTANERLIFQRGELLRVDHNRSRVIDELFGSEYKHTR